MYEHLVLYAGLRGKSDKAAVNREIDELLVEIALSEKKHTPSEALSGGQKRKLCAAMVRA